VHQLYASDDEVRAALGGRFGTIDRSRIGEIVFANPEELAWLESLLHPRVRRAYQAWLDQVDRDVAAVEVPLLYETGAEGLFDVVVVVTAPREVRRSRTSVDLDRRSGRLIPDDKKVLRADFSYTNDGTLEELGAFITCVLEHILSN